MFSVTIVLPESMIIVNLAWFLSSWLSPLRGAPFGLAPFGLAPFGLAPFGLSLFLQLVGFSLHYSRIAKTANGLFTLLQSSLFAFLPRQTTRALGYVFPNRVFPLLCKFQPGVLRKRAQVVQFLDEGVGHVLDIFVTDDVAVFLGPPEADQRTLPGDKCPQFTCPFDFRQTSTMHEFEFHFVVLEIQRAFVFCLKTLPGLIHKNTTR